MTDPDNWESYCDGLHYNGGNKFSLEYLKSFSEKYECLGQTTPESYTDFLHNCMQWLPKKTALCLVLGVTKIYEGAEEEKAKHKKLNDAIKAYAKSNHRISYIDIDDIVKDSSDFEGGINHYSTRVYYEIAQAMIKTVEKITGKQMQSYSSNMIVVDRFLLGIRKGVKRVLKPNGKLYAWLKEIYNKLYKQRK